MSQRPVSCPGCTYSGQPHLEGCPRGSSAIFSKTVPASKIVDAIIKDLSDRRGLRHEWEQIDDDIKKQIRDTWIQIVSNCGEER